MNEPTISSKILEATSQMRKRGTFETSSLCWDAQELERLAMFAIAAKNREETTKRDA